MSAGIEITNDNGIIQITDSFRNLQLIEKVTINTPSTVYFNITDVIAFRCDSGWATVFLNPIISGGQKTYNFRSSSGTMTYYRFGFIPTSTTSHYFEVYDPLGNRIFSDSTQPMKVLGSYTGSYDGGGLSWNGRTITNVTHSPLIKTAIVSDGISVGMLWNRNNHTNPTTIMEQTFTFNYDNINSTYNLLVNNNYGSEDYFSKWNAPYYSFLTIDVTNL